MARFSEDTPKEPYTIEVEMKSSLCLKKEIADTLKNGQKLVWYYTGRIKRKMIGYYSVDDGRAYIEVTVTGKKFAGLGYRRVIFELTNISNFLDFNDLCEEARQKLKSGLTADTLGIKSYDEGRTLIFSPGIAPVTTRNFPFPFEESLYKVSWT
jgi:hypothetical protein